jgi:mannose-6-phosphate isomerase
VLPSPREPLYPLLFRPALKDYVWGGRSLERLFGRSLPAGAIAESWEIAAHEDGTTIIANGYYAGRLLTDLQAELGLDLIGRNCAWAEERGKFPLLVKLLDANDNLSVQVHPDDAYAQAHEGDELGKTEMWVILHAEPDAAVILGVKPGTSPPAFAQAIREGRLELYLHHLPVKAGDVVCVPSRSVHAILSGLVLAEIQQNSNVTYRVYDWNRQVQGKARPLHVDKAMAVINFEQVEPDLCQPHLISDSGGIRRFRLCANTYFVTERVEMAQGAVYGGRCDGSTLEIWGCLAGESIVNGVSLPAVRFALLPAALGEFGVAAVTEATLLRTYVEAA